MTPRVAGLLILLSASMLAAQNAAAVPSRRALVISNAAHTHLGSIPNAAADAEAVGQTLRKANFVTVQAADLDHTGMLNAISAFVKSVQPRDVVIVYFIGYGIQVDNENYLLPIEFNPADQRDIGFRAYAITRILEELGERNPRYRIMVLDACRNSPLLAPIATGEGLLVPPGLEPGIVFSLSTLPGRTMNDLLGRGTSLFGEAFVSAIRKPGLALDQVFKEIQVSVTQATSGRQIPSSTSTVIDAFYINAPETKAGTVQVNPIDRLEYVWIPAGTAQIGCVPNDKDCEDDENPRHSAAIKGFWIGRTEVPVVAYRSFARNKRNGKMPRGTQLNPGWRQTDWPITNMPWEEAVEYCAWAGGRLPTEVEWEYSARGGLDGQLYPWGVSLTRANANYAGEKGDDQFMEIAPVRRYDPNPFGLYDTAGNVWEWCLDVYDEKAYSRPQLIDPKTQATGRHHVIRGGSFNSAAKHLRVSERRPSEGGNNVGFRCVVEKLP